MSSVLQDTNATARLAHIESHLTRGFDLEKLCFNIENGRGDPAACLSSLSSHALASAMSAWFKHHDLKAMHEWCYVAAKLDQRWYEKTKDTQSPGAKLLQLMKPLLSNDVSLISWFSNFDGVYDADRIEDPKTTDFFAYQAVLALRGEWDRLIDRCRMARQNPPAASARQKYMVDYDFWDALARQDIDRMQEVLQALVTPKMIHARSNDESGYTDNLISTYAVVYSKVAWFHGHEVNAATPYVPADWLPMTPLEHYDIHYDFLR